MIDNMFEFVVVVILELESIIQFLRFFCSQVIFVLRRKDIVVLSFRKHFHDIIVCCRVLF